MKHIDATIKLKLCQRLNSWISLYWTFTGTKPSEYVLCRVFFSNNKTFAPWSSCGTRLVKGCAEQSDTSSRISHRNSTHPCQPNEISFTWVSTEQSCSLGESRSQNWISAKEQMQFAAGLWSIWRAIWHWCDLVRRTNAHSPIVARRWNIVSIDQQICEPFVAGCFSLLNLLRWLEGTDNGFCLRINFT